MSGTMTTLKRFRQQILCWWEHRKPRERLLLQAAGAFCLATLLAQLLWTSHHEVERLEPHISRLERSATLIRGMVGELERTAIPASGETAAAPLAALPSLAGLKVTTLGGGHYRIDGIVGFDDWLSWLAGLHHDARIILVTANVKAVRSGEVQVTAELEIAH